MMIYHKHLYQNHSSTMPDSLTPKYPVLQLSNNTSSRQFCFIQTMSTNMVSDVSPPGGRGEPHVTTVGSHKSLHRFIRAEPKCTGIVMLFMGSSFFIFGIPLRKDSLMTSAENYTPFWLGILFIICGVLYLLTERRPSKPLVTASLALSIISILGIVFGFFDFLKGIIHQGMRYHHIHWDIPTNTTGPNWRNYHSDQVVCMEAIFMCLSLVTMILLIVMTTFARAALRSTKTQAIVIMHNLPSPE
ncbi:hypothetical protein DPEC_G00032630 [Dallia pectoralis]|uniref:Uncharacterized protein n=1 Tax=Dallia pectoralis TaxID=75939 RepID=A0ACC2HCL4_DALPE|nr:hypothetical protein DPEC_G00032630 [Dallia pectoralis]